MDNNIYTITLSDGTVLSDLALNGNNFVSQTEVTAADFDGKLSHVVISDGETEEVIDDAKLIQLAHYADGWYFILREIPEEQRRQMDIDALTVDHELRLTMLELGLDEF